MSAEALQRVRALADEPLRPAGPVLGFASGTAQSVRDVWAHRELLGLLVRREIKARYKDSVLGFAWSLIRPLTMLLIYYVAVGRFLGAARSIDQFAIYIFTGLTAWNLFNEIVTAGTGSIVGNGGLVKKVYLPREIFPLAAVGSALFNFVVQLIILVAAIVALRQIPSVENFLMFPLAFVQLLVWGLAIALVLSAINVYLRDTQYLVEVSLMVLFWASPVVYSWTAVHGAVAPWFSTLYLANPVTLAILGFQRAFWAAGATQPVPGNLAAHIAIEIAIGLVVLWLCQRVFARMQGNFAQEL